MCQLYTNIYICIYTAVFHLDTKLQPFKRWCRDRIDPWSFCVPHCELTQARTTVKSLHLAGLNAGVRNQIITDHIPRTWPFVFDMADDACGPGDVNSSVGRFKLSIPIVFIMSTVFFFALMLLRSLFLHARIFCLVSII